MEFWRNNPGFSYQKKEAHISACLFISNLSFLIIYTTLAFITECSPDTPRPPGVAAIRSVQGSA